MEAHDQVQFRTMFPNSWEKLQRQGAQIYHLHAGDEGVHVTVGWRRNRLVSAILDRLKRLRRTQSSPETPGLELFKAYVHQFERQRRSQSNQTITPLSRRSVNWMPGEKQLGQPESWLDSRQNLHVAVAMQLAGIVQIKENNGKTKLEAVNRPIEAPMIEVLDRCVNSSPVRLVYEYIAVSQQKSLPPQFIPQLLPPYLCEQFMAGTGFDYEEASHIIEGLLAQHTIEKASDLSLENLMEIKNAIRRLSTQHRRVISTIQGQRFLTRSHKAQAYSDVPLKNRTGNSTNPERLLADAGATIDTAHQHFVDQLRAAGMPLDKADNQIRELFEQHQMWGEQDFTLGRFIALADCVAGMEQQVQKKSGRKASKHHASRIQASEISVVEYISRLKRQHITRAGMMPERSIGRGAKNRTNTIHSSQNSYGLQRSKSGQWQVTGSPALTAPDEKPDVICDEDDSWLIQQQVDNGHLFRLFKDFAMRAIRWCDRNKRVMGVNAGLFLLMSAVYGAQTGGLSVVIMAATYVISSAAWFGIDLVKERIVKLKKIHQLNQAQKQRASNKGDSGDEVEDYLDSYSWLTRHSGLTNILNSFKNLQNEVKQCNEQPAQDASALIKQRRSQALSQTRFQQLEQAFGSLDGLIVESVQEISQLDQHFSDHFQELWAAP